MVKAASGDASYCIDSTETTWGEYKAFLDDGNVAPQTAACSWNDQKWTPHLLPTPEEPNGPNPNSDLELPVVGVDWCDAVAYCDWAGKRLCGKVGGGAVAFDQQNDATQSQWYAACSGGGKTIYPYGNDYDPAECNGADYGAGGLITANTKTCEGGFPHLYNMTGNSWDWENACDGSSGTTDQCWVRGGEFSNPKEFIQCDYEGFHAPRDFTSGSIGIRCCGP